MECIIIGAGNAGRPVARILNHTGNQVILTDRKLFEEFSPEVQETLKIMKNEGVKLILGSDASLGVEKVSYAYISPTVPENSPIIKLLKDKKVEML